MGTRETDKGAHEGKHLVMFETDSHSVMSTQTVATVHRILWLPATCYIELLAQPQLREPAQVHRTIAKMAGMYETQTAIQDTQLPGMDMWLEECEEKCDTYHMDYLLWGNSITDMVTRLMAAIEQGQKETNKMNTNGVGLEASTDTDLTK